MGEGAQILARGIDYLSEGLAAISRLIGCVKFLARTTAEMRDVAGVGAEVWSPTPREVEKRAYAMNRGSRIRCRRRWRWAMDASPTAYWKRWGAPGENLERIRRQTEGPEDMILQILDLARLGNQGGDQALEDVDLAEVASLVVDDVRFEGRPRDKLRDPGVETDTYAICTSHHGQTINRSTNQPPRLGEGTLWEGGMRVPFIVSGPGVAPGTIPDPSTLAPGAGPGGAMGMGMGMAATQTAPPDSNSTSGFMRDFPDCAAASHSIECTSGEK